MKTNIYKTENKTHKKSKENKRNFITKPFVTESTRQYDAGWQCSMTNHCHYQHPDRTVGFWGGGGGGGSCWSSHATAVHRATPLLSVKLYHNTTFHTPLLSVKLYHNTTFHTPLLSVKLYHNTTFHTPLLSVKLYHNTPFQTTIVHSTKRSLSHQTTTQSFKPQSYIPQNEVFHIKPQHNLSNHNCTYHTTKSFTSNHNTVFHTTPYHNLSNPNPQSQPTIIFQTTRYNLFNHTTTQCLKTHHTASLTSLHSLSNHTTLLFVHT